MPRLVIVEGASSLWSHKVPLLYDLALKVAVADRGACKFCKKDFRVLPDIVLFDFYHKMFMEKKLCLLVTEFSNLEVLRRVLRVKHRRKDLLKNFQQLVDYCAFMVNEVISNYQKYVAENEDVLESVEFGLKIGGFFKEGGWFSPAVEILHIIANNCRKLDKSPKILLRLLDCLYKKIYVEIYYNIMKTEATYQEAMAVINELREMNVHPNLAGIYAYFAAVSFQKSEYDQAYNWSRDAIQFLDATVPKQIVVDVLRLAAKSCVVKRHLQQAELLIKQAMSLATQLYEQDQHPRYSDVLLDYGFYLLNSDSIPMSVKYYMEAMKIRKGIFGKNNILVAIAYEDLSYAQYVKEYSVGNFSEPKENVQQSIDIMEMLLPSDHLLLASAKRVKALILEEMALDMREARGDNGDEYLKEAEALHKGALEISQKAFGENNVQTAKHYGNLGRLYQTLREYERAEQMHLKAIAIKEKLLGPDDFEVGLSVGHLASLYNYHMKRYEDAEKLYLRSIKISLKMFGDTYSGLGYDYRGIINVYIELQDIDNMSKFSGIVQQWQADQDVPRVSVYPERPAALDSLIKDFFSLELANA